MSHALYRNTSLFNNLYHIDQQLAQYVQQQGCPFCGGALHVADYPRKPRCYNPELVQGRLDFRFSFCCATEGCRKRCTPPSVRFLGRKVYLGVHILLLTALEGGLSPSGRCRLQRVLGLSNQTLKRLLAWWRTQVALTPFFRIERTRYLPVLDPQQLPGGILSTLCGASLRDRLRQCLLILCPLSTTVRVDFRRDLLDHTGSAEDVT